jgi:hypothetical protein
LFCCAVLSPPRATTPPPQHVPVLLYSVCDYVLNGLAHAPHPTLIHCENTRCPHGVLLHTPPPTVHALCHHPDAQTAHTTLPQRSHVCIEQLLCTCGCLGPLSLRRTCPPCRTTTCSTRIPMHTPHLQPPPPTMQRSVSARRQRVIGPSTTHSCCTRGILGLLGVVTTWCADSACVRILLHLRTSKMPPK